MSLFTCPICAAPLVREGNTYRCPSRHSYDVAREGYVHLLPANKKHSANPGDDRDMAAARTRFLDGGWYAPLRDALCRLAEEHTGPAPAVLDAGCGEGYYTAGIFEHLKNAKDLVSLAGVDLSKSALKKAARRTPEGEFAVASVYHLPAADGTADLLVDCFAPLALEEYRRVLKSGGVFLYVVPAPRHLLELKAVLYDAPYENDEAPPDAPSFSILEKRIVRAQAEITGQADIAALLHMTPYGVHSPREGIARLERLDTLSTEIEFVIYVLRKK